MAFFPSDLTPSGILVGVKKIGEVWYRSKIWFNLNSTSVIKQNIKQRFSVIYIITDVFFRSPTVKPSCPGQRPQSV